MNITYWWYGVRYTGHAMFAPAHVMEAQVVLLVNYFPNINERLSSLEIVERKIQLSLRLQRLLILLSLPISDVNLNIPTACLAVK